MMLLKAVVLMLSTMMLQAKKDTPPWFCHGLDCPVFSETKQAEGYEVREYQAAKWVSTIVEGYGYGKAVEKGFMRLFDYIGGANAEKQKIAMTAPVRVLVHPSDGPFCKSNFTISFFVPPIFQEAPPSPTREDIFIEETAKFTAYVVGYGGWQSEEKFTRRASELFTRLKEAGVALDEKQYYVAGYDSPFRLFNRHNEVWLIGKSESVSRGSAVDPEVLELKEISL